MFAGFVAGVVFTITVLALLFLSAAKGADGRVGRLSDGPGNVRVLRRASTPYDWRDDEGVS